VTSVGDGDTITVEQKSQRTTVRLACIDAPEARQAYGQNAATYLKNLLPRGTALSVQPVDHDRYGRQVAIVSRGGTNINIMMVRQGLAWVYEQYIGGCPDIATELRQAQQAAARQRLGLWDDPNPCTPQQPSTLPSDRCAPSYPDVCIPPAPPDLNCKDIPYRRLTVRGSDPHNFDRDRDGIGCVN
jgi:micrococcal nuclease